MQSINRFYDTGPGPIEDNPNDTGFCAVGQALCRAYPPFALVLQAIARNAAFMALYRPVRARPLDAVSMGFALGLIVLLLAVM